MNKKQFVPVAPLELRLNARAFERVKCSKSISKFVVSITIRRFLFCDDDDVVGVAKIDGTLLGGKPLGLDFTRAAPLSLRCDDAVSSA